MFESAAFNSVKNVGRETGHCWQRACATFGPAESPPEFSIAASGREQPLWNGQYKDSCFRQL